MKLLNSQSSRNSLQNKQKHWKHQSDLSLFCLVGVWVQENLIGCVGRVCIGSLNTMQNMGLRAYALDSSARIILLLTTDTSLKLNMSSLRGWEDTMRLKKSSHWLPITEEEYWLLET